MCCGLLCKTKDLRWPVVFSKLHPTLTLLAIGSLLFWPDIFNRLKVVTTTFLFVLDTWRNTSTILSNRSSKKESEYLGRL